MIEKAYIVFKESKNNLKLNSFLLYNNKKYKLKQKVDKEFLDYYPRISDYIFYNEVYKTFITVLPSDEGGIEISAFKIVKNKLKYIKSIKYKHAIEFFAININDNCVGILYYDSDIRSYILRTVNADHSSIQTVDVRVMFAEHNPDYIFVKSIRHDDAANKIIIEIIKDPEEGENNKNLIIYTISVFELKVENKFLIKL